MAKRLPPSQRPERLQRELPDEPDINSIEFIATHEAGHAVAAIALGLKLVSVDIHRRPHPSGRVSVGYTNSPSRATKEMMGKGEEAILPVLIQCMAGPLAEHRVNLQVFDFNSHDDDRANVHRSAAIAVCESTRLEDGSLSISAEEQAAKAERIGALVAKANADADALVSNHWDAITRVTAQLLKHRRLTGDQVAAIVKTAT